MYISIYSKTRLRFGQLFFLEWDSTGHKLKACRFFLFSLIYISSFPSLTQPATQVFFRRLLALSALWSMVFHLTSDSNWPSTCPSLVMTVESSDSIALLGVLGKTHQTKTQWPNPMLACSIGHPPHGSASPVELRLRVESSVKKRT